MKILLTYVIASVVALTAVPASAAPASSRALSIVAPSDERTIYDERGVVVVSFAAEPPLAEGDRIVVRVDAQVVVLPSGLTKFAITGVTPGTHVLEALLVDAADNAVAAAESITFQMGGGLRI
jgi:hypothetical protein